MAERSYLPNCSHGLPPPVAFSLACSVSIGINFFVRRNPLGTSFCCVRSRMWQVMAPVALILLLVLVSSRLSTTYAQGSVGGSDESSLLPVDCAPPPGASSDWTPPKGCETIDPAPDPLPPECYPPREAPLDWQPPLYCSPDVPPDCVQPLDDATNWTPPLDCKPVEWNPGTIAGMVTDTEGNPLADVNVLAYQKFDTGSTEPGTSPDDTMPGWEQEGWYPVGFASTGQDGSYVMTDLLSGTYRVQFNDWTWTYVSEYYNDKADIAYAQNVVVMAGETTPNIDAALVQPQPSIQGTVTNPDGKPQPGIFVEVYQIVYVSTDPAQPLEPQQYSDDEPEWSAVAYAETKEDGSYRVNFLSPGIYRLKFQDWSWTYPTEYYNDATILDSAQNVFVVDGETTSGIDVQLNTPEPSITGTVTDPNGKVVAGATVAVYQQFDATIQPEPMNVETTPAVNQVPGKAEGWYPFFQVQTAEDGTYSVNNLTPGTYRVEFSSGDYPLTYYQNQADLAHAQDVVVTDEAPATGIDAQFSNPWPSIGGTVTDLDGNPIPSLSVTAYQKVMYEDTTSFWWYAAGSATTGEDGTYTIKNLATGTYRVEFSLWGFPIEYYNDQADLDHAQDVDVTRGSLRDRIDASFDLPEVPPVWIDGDNGGDTIYDPVTGEKIVNLWRGELHDLVLTSTVTCDTGMPEEVTLRVQPVDDTEPFSVTMEPEDASDAYGGTIPADNLVPGALSIVFVCPGGEVKEINAGKVNLYDPSGTITDATTGSPVSGAQVELFRVSDWEPKASPTDTSATTCHTTLSKGIRAWSELSPATDGLGLSADPATGQIDPAQNPLFTGADGRYGWNVSWGCWYVKVQAEGYETTFSPVVGVPPQVTDLNLALAPAEATPQQGESTVYLPMMTW